MRVKSKVNEKDIFNWLVKHYYNRVLRTSLYYLKNRHDAEDITQDVFIKAFEKIDFSKTEESKFPILFIMAKNLSLNKLKSRGWKDESLPEWELTSVNYNPEDNYIKSEELQVINKSLKGLKDKDREVLVLKHYQDCFEYDRQVHYRIMIIDIPQIIFNSFFECNLVTSVDLPKASNSRNSVNIW